MWPFRREESKDRDAEFRALRAEIEDLSEGYMGQAQQIGSLKSALADIQKPMTDAGLNEVAASVTAQIADIYAAGRGGVKMRDAAVHGVVSRAIRTATVGRLT